MRLHTRTASCRCLIVAACGLVWLASESGRAAESPVTHYRPTQTAWSGGGVDSVPVIAGVSRQVYRLVVQADGMVKGGTGFLVSGNRIIATNNHVVDKGTAFALGYGGEAGKTRWVNLHLLAVFPQKDLAILTASENLPGEPLPLAEDFPELASDLYAIGFPAAADPAGEIGSLHAMDPNFVLPSVLRGTVSRIMTGSWITNQLQHQTPISPGYSGGPLVDRDGVVVGVSAAINKDASGISYGVASTDLARLLSACSIEPRGGPLHRFSAIEVKQTAALTAAIPPEEPRGAAKQSVPFDQSVLRRGYEMLRRGDISGARTSFEYAVRKGATAEAYKALAMTYDPEVLATLRVIGGLDDPKRARELYDMARKAGAATSPAIRTAAAECNNSLCVMIDGTDGTPVVVCNQAPK